MNRREFLRRVGLGVGALALNLRLARPATPPMAWFVVNRNGLVYADRGWPIGVLAVRDGGQRVPLWRSWDWRDGSFVYPGAGT